MTQISPITDAKATDSAEIARKETKQRYCFPSEFPRAVIVWAERLVCGHAPAKHLCAPKEHAVVLEPGMRRVCPEARGFACKHSEDTRRLRGCVRRRRQRVFCCRGRLLHEDRVRRVLVNKRIVPARDRLLIDKRGREQHLDRLVVGQHRRRAWTGELDGEDARLGDDLRALGAVPVA
eukprot:Amastigsp_a344166_7.p2 type:complete len:178 gc:universal Amastigsp_a344166_7:1055-522(-)